MTVQTVRPNAVVSLDAVNVTVTGANAAVALADNDDATDVSGHSYDGAGAGQAVVGLANPTVPVARSVTRVRARLRAADLDTNGTEIRATLANAHAALPTAVRSTATVVAAATYVGAWFRYRPQGGRWNVLDAQAMTVLLAYLSGATAAGASAIELYVDVDVTPPVNPTLTRDSLGGRRARVA